MPYKAKLLLHDRIVYVDGSFVEIRVWSVPKTEWTPEGLKYFLVHISADKRRLLGYDNSERKGHHRHADGVETPIRFDTMEQLITLFLAEVEGPIQ